MNQKEIEVHAHCNGLLLQMGTLTTIPAKGKEVFSFEYTPMWLASGFKFMLDPDLQLYAGRYFPRDQKQNFGVFLDSSPDRWGRVLMNRREAIVARQEKRSPKKLVESDYLLGVFDKHRMGGLRFRLGNTENFLDDDPAKSVPPWTSLRELEYASMRFEEDDASSPDSQRWLNMLLAPGSSLGGARPKAGVADTKGHLWIAKFPSINDENNTGAWELVANVLASKAGIDVAESMVKKFNTRHHTYLTKRFDRKKNGERIHFASAMTLLGYTDGTGDDTGASYLELVEFLMRHGADVNTDLKELWRRIVFSIAIKNTDDHLRNHGFLLTNRGWRLSPAYDLNANPHGTGLSLNISESDNSLAWDLAMEVAPYFRLDAKQAKLIMNRVKKSVSTWRELAKSTGLSKTEQDRLAPAFER